jgi:hypothetical protein
MEVQYWINHKGFLCIFGRHLYFNHNCGCGYYVPSTSPPPDTSTTTPDTTTSTSSNNPPIAIDESVTTSENTTKDITLRGFDEDSDDLIARIISQPLNGTVGNINQSTGVVTYVPNPGFIGTDQFTFEVNDGKMDGIKTGIVRIVINNILRNSN